MGPRDLVFDGLSVSRDTDQWSTDLTNVNTEVNTQTRSVVIFAQMFAFVSPVSIC